MRLPEDAALSSAEAGRRSLITSTCVAGLLVLLSLWRVHEFGVPGVSVCLALPLGLAGSVTWLTGAWRTSQDHTPAARLNVKWLVAAACLAVLAGGLAMTTVVPRLYFNVFARSAFDQAVVGVQANGLPTGSRRDSNYDRRVGGFYVDEVHVDAFGGIWFRYGSYPDMIDEVSFGYYYRPPNAATPTNRYGDPTSPFGAAGMWQVGLGDGWYFFQASNDSY